MNLNSKKIKMLLLCGLLSASMAVAGCNKKEEKKPEKKVEEKKPEEKKPEEKKPEEKKPEEKKPEEKKPSAPGTAGFEEIPIGEDKLVGPYLVTTVYFQAVDMYPKGQNPSAEESDMHLEADITLTNKAAYDYGFGGGEDKDKENKEKKPNESSDIWPAYLQIKYEIKDSEGKVVDNGSFMPMNAQDGPHYGTNIKKNKMKVGKYKLKLTIQPSNYLLHVDEETGVPALKGAEEYFKPQEVEFDWDYTGKQLQNR